MKNLEQVRATNALIYANAAQKTRGTNGGEVVKKLPALVMSNGLLAAGAFAYSKGEGEGWYVCFDHIAIHLSHADIAVLPSDKKTLEHLLEYLSREGDSLKLKDATSEALAWLCYARRFVKKPANEEIHHDSNES
ncbi:MAG: hypothetical protein KF833_13895 [Verrucomicrobiae bacterium]|nr:hypothetical protein [Verrucomicrobiae bacterium]